MEIALAMQTAQLAATICIGGIAGFIAWRQWRTAQDKVKLDLFDRRFAVFMDARRLASEAMQLGKITDPNLPNEVLARGRFLFGADIQDQLGELHRLCTGVMVKDANVHADMNGWLNQFTESVKPYMHMGHLKS